ncbi:MAG: HAMP domain-containing sensor histidine kinase [Bacillota bacterium]|nr:HAMP domain-containing sensor histidine kinase [Bacillota bacterium]
MKKKIGFLIVLFTIIVFFMSQWLCSFLKQMIYIASSNNAMHTLFFPNEIHSFSSFFAQGYNASSVYYLFTLYLKNKYVLGLGILLLIFLVCSIYFLYKERINNKQEKEGLIDSIHNRELDEENEILKEVSDLEEEYKNKILLMSLDAKKQNEEYENIAHQMKSSLSTILLNADLIEGNDKQKNRIIEQIERSNQLLNRFLQGYEVRMNQSNYQYKIYNFSNCIQHSLRSVKEEAEEKGIQFQVELTDCFFSMDPIWIEEAMETILKNALYYANTNSIVSVKLSKCDSFSILTIHDVGKEVDREDIFRRYASSSQNGEHFGIGLHMAKTIIENHFGTIKVFSENEGVTIKIEFPMHKLEIQK